MSRTDQYCDKLKDAGLVQSEADLGRLMGMGPSYVSCQKAKGNEPSVEAMATLAFNLDAELQELEDTIRHGTDLTADRLVAASIIYEVKNEIFARLKAKCRGGRHV
ncbi:conserved protein of unknown function [Magnetospirillum gryphiswaldense MSR-1 v2]|uniref:Uncharacterized protein n=1 Tax=Magnetospirillum gryphiswaldense (strain DSM 6361 / JCM 21280 / NBRC 15271 / MSR-1) TaxID=431944 RepID=V6F4H4_MAGGM|nr:DUF6626 family protein [Magnetospirillum gryphiswaldense]CDL00267.1 conserved protein of unknown function [Magnetospirillum gryphiswaldense MSR-1 v2]